MNSMESISEQGTRPETKGRSADRAEGQDDGEYVGEVSLEDGQAVPDARTGGHVVPDNQG